jgi:hypothetical protein
MNIDIEIKVKAAVLTLTENAGNLRASSGTSITWLTKDPRRTFTLDFFSLQAGGDDSPFECGATHGTVTAEKSFTVRLKERVPPGEVGAWKYSVSTGGLSLDPVIVMGQD